MSKKPKRHRLKYRLQPVPPLGRPREIEAIRRAVRNTAKSKIPQLDPDNLPPGVTMSTLTIHLNEEPDADKISLEDWEPDLTAMPGRRVDNPADRQEDDPGIDDSEFMADEEPCYPLACGDKMINIKPANLWLAEQALMPAPKKLFGSLWLEGELCLMYADTNMGKSLLAVQIGDSLGRGTAIGPFEMEARPGAVLYLDFELSAKQFELRYRDETGAHQFDPEFYRAEFNLQNDMPERYETFEDYMQYTLEWAIRNTEPRVLIIDNITCLSEGSHQAAGTAMALMRSLKKLQDKNKLSILVLAHTPKRNPGKPISLSNVRDEVNNKHLPDLNLNLYADGARGDKIYAAKSDSAGRFNFTGIMLYGKQNVKLSSVNNKGEKRGSFQVDSVFPMPVRPNVFKIAHQASIWDSLLVASIEKRSKDIKQANISKVTKLKEVNINDKKQNVYLRSGGVMQTWGPGEVFNITPNDYQYKTLEWYLLQFSKGAQEAVNDYNTINTPFIRKQTGVTYKGRDTFKITVTTAGASSPVRYIDKIKPLPPLLIVNGHELNMEEDYDQAETYRNIYFNMAINKFKKIELKHIVGTLHGLGINAQAEMISVDRYLLYLTLIDDALINNPGSFSIDVHGYYQARNFHQPPPNAKPQLADYRTTIHWEPNIKTNATGKATVSFYNAAPPTDVKVIVQGITMSGLPVVTSVSYIVK